MNKSESIKNLAGALAKAQSEMPVVNMNAKNPFLNNKYANLGAVIDTCRPVLAKFELSVSQLPASEGDRFGLTTILMHSSGEWIENTVFIPLGEQKGLTVAQVAGSIISYLRRYSLASVLGMYADEDTDGNNGHKPDVVLDKKPAPEKKVPSPATYIQKLRVAFSAVYAKADSMGIKDLPKLGGKSAESEIKAATELVEKKIREVQNVSAN